MIAPTDRAAFYEWVVGQEFKYELVDGEPVMRAGANQRHQDIAANTLSSLHSQLRGRKCRPTAGRYGAVPTINGNIRYPDVVVDCGPRDDQAMQATMPTLLIEILSPPTREFDRNERLEDYKTVQTLEYILLVDPDLPQVRLYRRDSNRGWISGKTVGLDAAVELPSLGVLLRLADIYAGLAFGHAQR